MITQSKIKNKIDSGNKLRHNKLTARFSSDFFFLKMGDGGEISQLENSSLRFCN